MHQAVLWIIDEIGFEVNSETALALFAKAGARVDGEKHRVCLSQEMVMELVAMAPSEVRLCGQEEEHDILLGGSRISGAGASGASGNDRTDQM